MKTTRALLSTSAVIAIAAVTLAGGGAASAADFRLTAADLTATETSPYSPGWFQGTVPGGSGTLSSGLAGLTMTGNQVQVLNGTPGATDLTDVGTTVGITMSDGQASFQIPVFAGTGGTSYTTLYADAAGIASDTWFTSQAVFGFGADTAHALADYEAAFDADYEILAFGFNKAAGSTATIASLEWNGDTYWFLPAPTIGLSDTTVTPDEAVTPGVTVTASGFIPGESVDLYFSTASAGGPFTTVVADAGGVATGTYTAATAPAAGSYTLGAFGQTSEVNVSAALTVAAAPALAAAGAEVTPVVAAGAALLLFGAIAFAVGARRRRAA